MTNPIRRARRAAAALLALGLAGGCSSYRDPAIVVSETRLIETTDEAAAVGFALDLRNPNDEPLKLLQFEYDLLVNGVSAYSGIRSAQATLAANGARRLEVPAVIRFDDVDAAAPPATLHYRLRGTLQYVTPGEIAQVLFDTGVRKPRAGFTAEGDLALPR
jgi:hypothetical protein